MTPGTVILSLTDVEKLKKDIADRDKTIKKKDEKIAEKEKELVELEADKRIIEITKEVDVSPSINIYLKEGVGNHVMTVLRTARDTARFRHDAFDNEIAQAIKPYIKVDTTEKNAYHDWAWHQATTHRVIAQLGGSKSEAKQTGKVFINFEDVQRELREAAEAKVAEELGDLRAKTANQQEKIAKLQEKQRQEIDQLTDKHTEETNALHKQYGLQIKELNEAHKEHVEELEASLAEWKEKYDDLKFDRDTRTTEQRLLDRINELKIALEEERKKSWFKKLLGK
jgi:cell division protein FtsL